MSQFGYIKWLTRTQGDETTFVDFPEDLRCLLQQLLPDISILVAVYPRFETRGSLDVCVSTFKLWFALPLR